LSSIEEKSERQRFFKTMLLEHENIDNINNLKNFSLYTSIIGVKFLSPQEIITDVHLRDIEQRARIRFSLVKDFIKFSLKHFNTIKKSNLEANENQIEALAIEYFKDLLSGHL
jgi:hypothetical protein